MEVQTLMPQNCSQKETTSSRLPDRQVASLEHRLQNIRFRPIRADDWHRLQLFHQRLSARTVEFRFHGAKKALSEALSHRFTQLERTGNSAIVATTGTRGRIIGVARYCRLGDSTAEVAFVVEDEFQGHGVGHRLMRRLRDMAVADGITVFVAEVLPGNAPMFRLLKEAGDTNTRYVGGVREVCVDIQSPGHPATPRDDG
jgi:RimJ/RimL family protein N-acetyltransferase